MIIIPIKWLFHWEYTQHFQTSPKKKWPELAIWFAHIWGRKRHPSERGQGGPGGEFDCWAFGDLWTFQEKEHEGTNYAPGWWFGTIFIFFHNIYIYGWEFHHPNCYSLIFQRGWLKPPSSLYCHEILLLRLDGEKMALGHRNEKTSCFKRQASLEWRFAKCDWGNHQSVKCSSWG